MASKIGPTIKFKQKEYTESVDLFYEFANKITEEKQLLNESFYISSFSMLVSSLFNLGRFEEIIDLEKDYLEYTQNRNKISTTSPITDFYIGASAESIGHGDGSYPMDAVFRDAMDSGLDSSNFGLFEMPEKFKYFREANDVMTNRVLPAGKPRAYRGQYSKSDRKVVIKL